MEVEVDQLEEEVEELRGETSACLEEKDPPSSAPKAGHLEEGRPGVKGAVCITEDNHHFHPGFGLQAEEDQSCECPLSQLHHNLAKAVCEGRDGNGREERWRRSRWSRRQRLLPWWLLWTG